MNQAIKLDQSYQWLVPFSWHIFIAMFMAKVEGIIMTLISPIQLKLFAKLGNYHQLTKQLVNYIFIKGS